jgi:hypothetical protein
MKDNRIKQRIAHTIDNIGGRDLPHAIIHSQDALKAKSLPEAKDHITRVLGHLNEASKQSGMLSEAIKTVPGVVKEGKRLAVEQTKSDGLVQPAKKKKKKVAPFMKSK